MKYDSKFDINNLDDLRKVRANPKILGSYKSAQNNFSSQQTSENEAVIAKPSAKVRRAEGDIQRMKQFLDTTNVAETN